MAQHKIKLSSLSRALLLLSAGVIAAPSMAVAAAADDDAALQAALNATYDDEAAGSSAGDEAMIKAAMASAPAAGAGASASDAGTGGGDDNVYDLGRTVVSASGFAQDLREAPASMSIVTGDEVRSIAARDIGDMVAGLPGIEISKSKTGNSNVMIRGFGSDYTAFLIDGKRQNSSSAFIKNGFDPNFGYTPPASMIERIEVIRGPASTLYGSDAVGGVVNIITKSHPENLSGSVGFETLMQEHPGFGNAAGLNGNVNIPLVNDRLSMQLRGRYYEKDHTSLKTPEDKYLSHSANDFDLYNYGARIVYSPVKGHDLSVDGEQYYMKAGAMSTSSKGIAVLNRYRKDQITLNYDGKYDFGDVNSYLQYYNHTRDDVGYDFFSRSLIFESKAVTPFAFSNGQALNLTSGFQFWRDEFRDDSNASATSPYKDDITGHTLDHNTFALYMEGEYFLSDDWIATLGARYNYSDIFGSHITPRGYLVYKATSNLTFKGGIAAGYKTPNVKQLVDGVYQQDNFGAHPMYGSPDLKPETSVNYELSVMYELPKIGSLTLTGFLTDFNDKLASYDYAIGESMPNGVICNPYDQSVSNSRCTLSANRGKTRSKGIEVLFSTARFYDLRLEGSYTWTNHEYRDGDSAGKAVNAIPAHAAMARLSWDKENYGLFLKGTGKFRTPYISTRSGASFDYYKNYVIFDMGGYYKFSPEARLNVTINNLLDFDAYDEFDVVKSSKGTNSYNTYYRDYIEGRSVYVNFTYDF